MTKKNSTDRKDIFTNITDTIVAAIEAGASKYEMPWNKQGADSMLPVNAVTRKPYRGANVLMLWATAEEKGYPTHVWATYKQWEQLGAQVRKGEKSSLIIFWKFRLQQQEAADAPTEEATVKGRVIPMARAYCVFNAAQVDGWKGGEVAAPTKTEAQRMTEAENFFRKTGARIHEGGNRACYNPLTDEIRMPKFEQFKAGELFYSTLAHEIVHWTGGRSERSPRDLNKRFGSEGYAMEELVAELGSAFLSAELGLQLDARKDHAPYVQNWLTVLKNDKRAIFTAATKAQNAVDYLLKLTGWAGEEEPDGEEGVPIAA